MGLTLEPSNANQYCAIAWYDDCENFPGNRTQSEGQFSLIQSRVKHAIAKHVDAFVARFRGTIGLLVLYYLMPRRSRSSQFSIHGWRVLACFGSHIILLGHFFASRNQIRLFAEPHCQMKTAVRPDAVEKASLARRIDATTVLIIGNSHVEGATGTDKGMNASHSKLPPTLQGRLRIQSLTRP